MRGLKITDLLNATIRMYDGAPLTFNRVGVSHNNSYIVFTTERETEIKITWTAFQRLYNNGKVQITYNKMETV